MPWKRAKYSMPSYLTGSYPDHEKQVLPGFMHIISHHRHSSGQSCATASRGRQERHRGLWQGRWRWIHTWDHQMLHHIRTLLKNSDDSKWPPTRIDRPPLSFAKHRRLLDFEHASDAFRWPTGLPTPPPKYIYLEVAMVDCTLMSLQ